MVAMDGKGQVNLNVLRAGRAADRHSPGFVIAPLRFHSSSRFYGGGQRSAGEATRARIYTSNTAEQVTGTSSTRFESPRGKRQKSTYVASLAVRIKIRSRETHGQDGCAKDRKQKHKTACLISKKKRCPFHMSPSIHTCSPSESNTVPNRGCV